MSNRTCACCNEDCHSEALRYREALRKLFMANQNEMRARGVPLEWQDDSAMGIAADLLMASLSDPKRCQHGVWDLDHCWTCNP